MKLKLTYQPEEAQEVNLILHFVRELLPGVRVHKNESKAPFIHLYLTTKRGVKKDGGE